MPKQTILTDQQIRCLLEGDDKGKIDPVEAATVLINHTEVKYLVCYQDCSQYVYFDTETCNHEVWNYNQSINFLTRVLKKYCGLNFKLLNRKFVQEVLSNMQTSYRTGVPKQTNRVIAFENGIYSLNSGKLRRFSRWIFVPKERILPFPLDENGPKPNFDEFLDFLCDGEPDRLPLFRAILRLSMEPMPSAQKFFYLHGPGGCGKSTYAKVLQCLAGNHGYISTTLPLLSKNIFEGANFVGKTLCLVSDPGRGKHNNSALLQITGNDSAPIRKKHQQGSYDEQLNVTIFMCANFRFETTDTSGAIVRRIISIPITKTPSTLKILMSRDSSKSSTTKFKGAFVPELGAIAYWALKMSLEEIEDILLNTILRCPSLADEQKQFELKINSVKRFVGEYIIQGKGAAIGLKKRPTKENAQLAKDEGQLYPAYQIFCSGRGLELVSHNEFSVVLMDAAEKQGLKPKKERNSSGMFIKGICLNPTFYIKN